MEKIKQPIRKAANHLNMPPKVFAFVCFALIILAVAGLYAVLKPHAQNSNIAAEAGVKNAPALNSGKTDNEENSAVTEEYHSQDPNSEPKDGPTLEIKVNGTSNKNFTSLMIRTDNGQSSKTVPVQIISSGIELEGCKVTQKTDFDNDSLPVRTQELKAVATQTLTLEDGLHSFSVNCKKEGVTSSMDILIADGQPERCKGFGFSESAVTAHSLQDLQSGIVGTWKGCVAQPWLPTYEVTMVFKADGTYDSYSNEKLDGQDMIGLYYGTDNNNPAKKYQLTGLSNDIGSGRLTIYFENSNTTVTNDLQNVKLMGNKLSFSFNHLGQYGPLSFQLNRQ